MASGRKIIHKHENSVDIIFNFLVNELVFPVLKVKGYIRIKLKKNF